jgi:anaerobic magnesium-protoporphyrin IX monomethyl ester cyclase
MKVVLINPPFARVHGIKGHGGALIPLNLCCLAAYARDRHPEVEFSILDAEALALSPQQTVEKACELSADVIGITCATSAFGVVAELTQSLKKRLPNSFVVLGGPHPSALPEQSLRESSADFVAIGEGEETFSELLVALKNGKENLRSVAGLAFLENNGDYRQNEPRPLIPNLDELPFPARDLLDIELYSPPPTKRVALGPNTMISTSRGCPHNCGFCGAHLVWTRKVRMRSPVSVVDEIQECVEKFRVTSINFTDEFFTASKKRVLAICSLLRERGLTVPWVCMARAERLDDETLQAMKEAGCREISFGIESGNQDILNRICKKLDLNEAFRVVKAAQRAGMTTHASYIVGYLGETVDTIKDTIRFAKRLNTDVAAFFIASPLPGTPLYKEALETGCLRADMSWKNFSIISNEESVLEVPGLTIQEIRHWHRKALRSYYLRPAYIIARIMRIRHWYEIRNLLAGLRILFAIKK